MKIFKKTQEKKPPFGSFLRKPPGGLSGSSGGLTGSTRVGAYHRTNKLLFHVGPAIYKLLGGFPCDMCFLHIVPMSISYQLYFKQKL